MAHDKPAPPPGTLAAALALLAGAVGGAVMAVRQTDALYLVCGVVIFAGGAFLGGGLLYAWFKGRR
ncbi:hypothetical protein [Amycolatopsis vastitatis]|uniref:Uncharacterized protein n=1 Tax=Amycolatopsis vastitatis TaxID=1905142 RepID=A0A229T399_9PSEU|nr:hypothetical protein [Amycolatopsis vastitatis]OXM65421.1 hypothetical protein CF165_24205 [Amycolatopsis vastitatis]